MTIYSLLLDKFTKQPNGNSRFCLPVYISAILLVVITDTALGTAIDRRIYQALLIQGSSYCFGHDICCRKDVEW